MTLVTWEGRGELLELLFLVSLDGGRTVLLLWVFFWLVRGRDDDLVAIGVRVGRDCFFPGRLFCKFGLHRSD